MNRKIPTIEQLVELAKEVETNDPIDWNDLNISEDHAYNMIANQVMSDYLQRNPDEHEIVMLATITKLIVENFTLNIRLLQEQKRNASGF